MKPSAPVNALLVCSLALTVSLLGCGSKAEKPKSPQDVRVDALQSRFAALNEKMNGVAVGVNAAHDQLPVAIGQSHRFEKALAAAAGCFLPGRSGIFHFQGDRFHAVTMPGDVFRDRIVGPQRCS